MINTPRLIDMNSHLSFLPKNEAENTAKLANEHNIHCVLAGYDESDFQRQKGLQLSSAEATRCLGLHPWVVAENFSLQDQAVQNLYFEEVSEECLRLFGFIGEVGLDFSNESLKASREVQEQVFKQALSFAVDSQMPLLLHVVNAHGCALEVLSQFGQVSGIVHGFSGSPEVAARYIELGLKISIGPSVLNPNYKKLRSCLLEKKIAQNIVFETDQIEANETDPRYNFDTINQIISETSSITGIATRELIDRARAHFLQLL